MLGEAPSPRANFGFAMSSSEFVVFGGFNDYDMTWTNLTANMNGLRPAARWAAGLTSVGSKIYLFGGQDCSLFLGLNNGSYFGKLYTIDLSKPLEWIIVTNISGTPPSPRSGHGFASLEGLLYVYGGQTEDGNDNSQLFMFDPATSIWTDLTGTIEGISPSPRFNFGLCTFGDIMYIFGGIDVDNTAIRINRNDMYALSISPVASTWMDLSGQVHGEASVPRYRAYAVTAHQKLYLYGGSAADGSMVANVNEFDVSSLSWRNLSNNCVNGDELIFTSISALASVNDSLYLFQGNENEDPKELFEFDFAQGAWINLTKEVRGTPPSQRSYFYVAPANGKLYVFGGFGNGTFFNDLHCLEVKTRTWTNLTGQIAGTAPKPRFGLGFTCTGDDLYVFGGGLEDGTYLNDLYKFDTSSMTWTDLTEDVYGTAPSPRVLHGFVSEGSFLFCFGGISSGYLSDLHMFDTSILKWTDLTRMAQDPPSARYGHGFASLLGKLCVFGGKDVTDYLGDVRLIVSPKTVQWPLKETAYFGFVSIYDWDTIHLQAEGGVLFFPLTLCTGIFPCALSVRGPGTIEREGNGGIACFASLGCTGIILESICLSCDENRSSQPTLKFHGSELSIYNSTFSSCLSETDGGFIQSYDSASVQIDSCKFQNLHTSGFGGALSAVGSKVVVSKTSFLNCSSDHGGGAIWVSSYTCFGEDIDTLSQEALVRISQSQFRGCSTLGRGGAILSSPQTARVEVADCFIGLNSAKSSGGAISLESSASMVIRNSDFFGNLASGIGGGAFYVDDSFMIFINVSCKSNIAMGGGGVLFWVGSWEPLISETLVQYTNQVTGDRYFSRNATIFEEHLCTADNRAMYGPCVATAYQNFFVSGVPRQDAPAWPGQPLSVIVSKMDAYNQTVSSDSSSIILVQSAMNGDINTIDRFVTLSGETVIPFKRGEAVFSVSVQPSFRQVAWQGEITIMQTQPYIFFYGTDLQTFLPMLSDAQEVFFLEGNRVCPSGYILNLEASSLFTESARPGSCKQCQGGTYSVSPLFGMELTEPSCLQCPAGGVCFGGNNVSFAVGQWQLNGGLYRLISCPSGHELVDTVHGTFRQDVQQCIACLPNEYILNPNSSNFSCQACPSFAICNGSVLSARIQGTVWKVDQLTGTYVLVSCPAGYELDSIPQQCSMCPAEHYCIGGSRAATACPDGYFSVAGANSSQLCFPAVFIVFSASLPMSTSEFESKQQLYLDAAAATVHMPPARVVLLSVGRRSQSDVVLVDTEVAADDAAQANTLAGLLNQDNLNVQLTARAFPPATLQSVTVKLNDVRDQSTSMSRNIIIASTLAAFGIMLSLIVAGYYLLREVRRNAAQRAFVAAFANSTAGSSGTLNHLPLKLRFGFTAEMVLGKGAYGIVIQVQTKKGNKKAAIKLILPNRNSFDDNESRQLKREAHVLELFTAQKCEYAVNLIGIESINIDKDICWFIMELLVGDNMDVISKHGPITDFECIKVGRHVLAALKLMHAEGLLHRDIKPANIVRIFSTEMQSVDSNIENANCSYKLVDFGTALGVDEKIAKEHMMTLNSNRNVGAGTPPYMSPEMFNSPETATYSTDLWSLGISIFELATGSLPFVKKEDESDLIWSSIIAGNMDHAAPNILDRLDEEKRSKFDHNLTKVIAKALEKRTSKRYTSVDEMHDDLYQCLIEKGEASYSVFISYRVASDAPVARILFDALNHSVTPGGHRVTVYWDAHRLIKGENWEEGFATGLLNSLCFFPILTYGATAPLAALPEGKYAELCSKCWEERPLGRQRLQGLEHDWEDNVLKEFLIAGALLDRIQADVERGAKEKGMLQSIFPILIGRPHPLGTRSYPNFGDFFQVQGGAGEYPKRPSPPTNRSVVDFLRKRACLPPDFVDTVEVRSVQEAVQCLTKLQGCQLWKHSPGISEVELTKEQASLIGMGCVGPAVDLKIGGSVVQLTEEQRAACHQGYDMRQLKMLKALVQEKLLDFHEVIDRSIAAATAKSPPQRDHSILPNQRKESVASADHVGATTTTQPSEENASTNSQTYWA